MEPLAELACALVVIVAVPRIAKYFFISLMWAWGIDWR